MGIAEAMGGGLAGGWPEHPTPGAPGRGTSAEPGKGIPHVWALRRGLHGPRSPSGKVPRVCWRQGEEQEPRCPLPPWPSPAQRST